MTKLFHIALLIIFLVITGWGARRAWRSFVFKSEPNVIIVPAPPPLIYVVNHTVYSKESIPVSQRVGPFVGQPGWRYFCLQVDNNQKVMVGRADCTTAEKFNAYQASLERK